MLKEMILFISTGFTKDVVAQFYFSELNMSGWVNHLDGKDCFCPAVLELDRQFVIAIEGIDGWGNRDVFQCRIIGSYHLRNIRQNERHPVFLPVTRPESA